MKLNNKEIQPYRVWYEYLQTALNDKNYSNKVNKSFYKDWHLNLVKKQKFNQWIKNHEHLFADSKIVDEIKLYEGKRTPNTIMVEIPVSYTVRKIQVEIGKVVKGKVAKTQTNKRFKIQIKKNFVSRPFDHFLWAYQFYSLGKYKLIEIWELVDKKQRDRQSKVSKRIENYKKTGKGIRPRVVGGRYSEKDDKNKPIITSRNIKKAQTILTNVCKGIFPGNYSDH